MASLVRLILTSNGTAADFKSQSNLAPLGAVGASNFSTYVTGLTGGNEIGAKLDFAVGAVQSTGTVTFTSTGPTNGQTCTLFGVTFTAVTSSATGNQFNINATPTTVAANFVTAVNAATSLAGIVTATSLLGVVTVTAVAPGKIGNGLVMANVNLSNTAFVTLAGGSDGTAYSIDLR